MLAYTILTMEQAKALATRAQMENICKGFVLVATGLLFGSITLNAMSSGRQEIVARR